MKYSRLLALFLVGLSLNSESAAQTLVDLDQLWHQTFDALKAGQADRANESFANFNKELHLYLKTNKLDWKTEFLAGSVYCQFAQSRETGAAMLKTILQDSRDLSDKAKDELHRLLNACTVVRTAPPVEAPHDLPADIVDASAHFQAPGVHSFTKGGYISKGEEVSGVAVSPKPAPELLARRVQLSEPRKALDAALARLGGQATGGIVGEFAVTTARTDPSEALGIGKCLASYTKPMREQFDIDSPSTMVTVYTAQWTDQVYQYARRLHGLALPAGVVAYSVAEDMSLTGMAGPNACGSMAHELVHLLIKPKFPLSPAWLEEGLASEVAVASPQGGHFKFSPSWRDKTLKDNWSLRPSVGKLLELSWSDFNAAGRSDLRQAAAVQAMAAVFIRYLDNKGKLANVYFAVRDHLFSADLSEFRTYRQIVEEELLVKEKLGGNVDDIDKDFERWFQTTGSQFSNSSGNASAGYGPNAPPHTTAAPCTTSSPMQQAPPDCVSTPVNKKAP
jgi:hypothetical protein